MFALVVLREVWKYCLRNVSKLSKCVEKSDKISNIYWKWSLIFQLANQFRLMVYYSFLVFFVYFVMISVV